MRITLQFCEEFFGRVLSERIVYRRCQESTGEQGVKRTRQRFSVQELERSGCSGGLALDEDWALELLVNVALYLSLLLVGKARVAAASFFGTFDRVDSWRSRRHPGFNRWRRNIWWCIT